MPVAIDTPKDLDNRLMSAAARGDREQVEFLLAHGAGVHAWYDYALRMAAEYGQTDTVALLRASDALEMLCRLSGFLDLVHFGFGRIARAAREGASFGVALYIQRLPGTTNDVTCRAGKPS